MGRLTERIEEHYIARQDRVNGKIIGNQQCLDKLGRLEDAEEKGLLLRLPCKIGDIVYSVTRNFISEYTICSIEKYNEGFFFNWRCEKGIYSNIRGFTGHEIGATVFLTKEEAEQALKEMEKK